MHKLLVGALFFSIFLACQPETDSKYLRSVEAIKPIGLPLVVACGNVPDERVQAINGYLDTLRFCNNLNVYGRLFGSADFDVFLAEGSRFDRVPYLFSYSKAGKVKDILFVGSRCETTPAYRSSYQYQINPDGSILYTDSIFVFAGSSFSEDSLSVASDSLYSRTISFQLEPDGLFRRVRSIELKTTL